MATLATSRPQVGDPDRGGWLLEAFRRVVNGALLVLFAAVASLALVTYGGPAMGFETFTIRGRSMEPAIPLGSIAIVAAADDLRRGDVITYRATDALVVTHRVVGFESVNGERHYVTRGDASAADDATPVDPSQIVGRVQFHVPVLGYLSWMLSIPSGLLAIVSGLLMLLLLQLWLDDEVDAQRRERRARLAAAAQVAAKPRARRARPATAAPAGRKAPKAEATPTLARARGAAKAAPAARKTAPAPAAKGPPAKTVRPKSVASKAAEAAAAKAVIPKAVKPKVVAPKTAEAAAPKAATKPVAPKAAAKTAPKPAKPTAAAPKAVRPKAVAKKAAAATAPKPVKPKAAKPTAKAKAA